MVAKRDFLDEGYRRFGPKSGGANRQTKSCRNAIARGIPDIG